MLRTIHDRWGTAPLTQRDKAATSLADAITLKTPRQDDPLQGVALRVSTGHHPNSSTPSKIDRTHAARVAALPIRKEKNHYEEATPDIASSAAISNFIRDRTAAWKDHVQRRQQRHSIAPMRKLHPSVIRRSNKAVAQAAGPEIACQTGKMARKVDGCVQWPSRLDRGGGRDASSPLMP